MGLTPEQRRTAAIFIQEAQRAGASPRVKKALLEAGLAEANLLNPAYGDRDSLGSLQERASYGSAARRLDRHAAARRFIGEAMAANRGFRGSAGELAQAVQRSAFPARYDQRGSQAAGILRALDGATARRAAGGSPGVRASMSSAVFSPPALAAVPGLTATAPALPSGAARSRGGLVTPGAPPVARAGIAGALASLAAALPAAAGAVPAVQAASAGTETPRAARGRVVVAPGANAPGKPLTAGIQKLLGELAAATGQTVRVGTGTNHSYLTVDGNVSDHATGNAADLPATGTALRKLFAQALQTYGAGQTVQFIGNNGTRNVKLTPQGIRAVVAEGGLVNLGYGKTRRIQIIGATQIGGNHETHLHVGVSGRR